MGTKGWYASKTIWGGIIMFIATALQLTGVVDISATEQSGITDSILGLVTVGGQLVGAILAIYGRIRAKATIGKVV